MLLISSFALLTSSFSFATGLPTSKSGASSGVPKSLILSMSTSSVVKPSVLSTNGGTALDFDKTFVLASLNASTLVLFHTVRQIYFHATQLYQQ